MKMVSFVRLLVVVLAVGLLATGCAKKPAVDESSAQQQTQVSDQRPASVSDTAIADDPEAAARRAAAAGLQRIHFDFDKSDLTDEAKAILVQNAALLRAAPGVRILIEGHCDERGSDEYNLALGERRAIATRNYLVSLGVAEDRMRIISYGEEMPIALERTEEAWAKNRRAEFKITH